VIEMNTSFLRDALQGTGFVRRGSAFFRVWGDGVLQVLKFTREHRGDHVHELSVGVFSMYGKLLPEWFTSFGCIPQGSVVGFAELRYAEGYLFPRCFTKNDEGQFFCNGFPVSVDPKQWMRDKEGEQWRYFFTPEQQIRILKEKGLPWLNDMTDQSSAAAGMAQLLPRPNDGYRFDAHLAAGELDQAEQTVAAILKQFADAPASVETGKPHQEEKEKFWNALLNMVRKKDEEAISRYLNENYKRNCGLAKFCMKQD